MDLSRYTALFLTESREQLGAAEQALLEWERSPAAAEPVVALFRAMHSFKGMAAAMGYAHLTELAHRAETVLEGIRHGPAVGRGLIDLFLRIVAALEQGAGQAAQGGDPGLDFSALLAEFGPVAESAVSPGHAAGPEPVAPVFGSREVRVVIRPGAAMRGARAMLAVRKAESFGRVSDLRPPISGFELDSFDGKFSFQLQSDRADGEVQDALRTVGDVATVQVLAAEVGRAAGGGSRGRQIRMDLSRLDAVMNLVGELVVAKGRLGELADEGGSPELRAVSSRLDRIAGDLYGEVMQARLTPVWQVFDRFPRVVRDLARQLGRQVRLEVEGEETQLDRALLDELGEPLIHLLRNAVDHGIEAPAARVALGKPVEGVIRLTATNDRSTVLIRVEDDGAGIDRTRVLAKAVQAGLAPPDAEELSDDELLRLISRPGFSTASQVTQVSGRGIGMEAVTARLRALGGSVEVSSVAGTGTTFTLRLPMTLALLRALLAQVGGERYAIPLSGIAETVEFRGDRRGEIEGREALLVRDELIPMLRLRDRLGVTGARPPGRQPVVILEVGDRRAAVLVDALVGQQEIVVEPFDAPRGTLPVFSGATILGDGAPALIVDPAALV